MTMAVLTRIMPMPVDINSCGFSISFVKPIIAPRRAPTPTRPFINSPQLSSDKVITEEVNILTAYAYMIIAAALSIRSGPFSESRLATAATIPTRTTTPIMPWARSSSFRFANFLTATDNINIATDMPIIAPVNTDKLAAFLTEPFPLEPS